MCICLKNEIDANLTTEKINWLMRMKGKKEN